MSARPVLFATWALRRPHLAHSWGYVIPEAMPRLRTILELPPTTQPGTKITPTTTIGHLRSIKRYTCQSGPLKVTNLRSGRVVYSPSGYSSSGLVRTVKIQCGDHLHPLDERWRIELSRPDEEFSESLSEVDQAERELREYFAWSNALPITVKVTSCESLESFSRELDEYVRLFQIAKSTLGRAALWSKIGVRPFIVCNCGHSKQFGGLGPLADADDTFSAEPRLKCSACGVRGQARIVPVMMEGYFPPDAVGYKGVGSRVRTHIRGSSPRDDLVDLHRILSPDENTDAYLSDGLMIRPDGSIY
jgi:hypothetical protein